MVTAWQNLPGGGFAVCGQRIVTYSIHSPGPQRVFVLSVYEQEEKDLQEFFVLVWKYLTKRGKRTLCGIIVCSYHKHPVASGGYVKKVHNKSAGYENVLM